MLYDHALAFRSALVASIAAMLVVLPSDGQSLAAAATVTVDVLPKAQLAEQNPGLAVEDIGESPMSSLYEIDANGRILYVSVDGRFLFQGDIIDLQAKRNLTEARRAELRANELRQVEPAGEIVFTPESGIVTHRITVFTDVDCGYCRQLHRDIATINALGIEVHYVSFPRTGPNTESWARAEGVWCAENRNEALTEAKLGAAFAAAPACADTIKQHYELGGRIGVSGTPAIYTEAGVEIGGYLPPMVMLEQLEKFRNTP